MIGISVKAVPDKLDDCSYRISLTSETLDQVIPGGEGDSRHELSVPGACDSRSLARSTQTANELEAKIVRRQTWEVSSRLKSRNFQSSLPAPGPPSKELEAVTLVVITPPQPDPLESAAYSHSPMTSANGSAAFSAPRGDGRTAHSEATPAEDPSRGVDATAARPRFYAVAISTASPTTLRARLREFIELAQREPVEIVARDGSRLAVMVSPVFFDRAFAALEDEADLKAAAAARAEAGVVAHSELMAELEQGHEREPRPPV